MKNVLKSDFILRNKAIIITMVIFLVACAYVLISENYRKNALKKSMLTWAKVVSINNLTKMGKSLDLIYYNDKHEKIEILNIDPPRGCTGQIKVKDTIFIKYSLTNNNVIEIIECSWNEKLRKLTNESK